MIRIPYDQIKFLPHFRRKCPTCGHVIKIRVCPICKKEFKLTRIDKLYCCRLHKNIAINRRNKEIAMDDKWGL